MSSPLSFSGAVAGGVAAAVNANPESMAGFRALSVFSSTSNASGSPHGVAERMRLLRGIRSLARQQAKELRIREIRICTGTIGIVSVDLVVTRCH